MTLKLTLFRKHFDDILCGIKTEEYRLVKKAWMKLEKKNYHYVEFTNGYGAHRPWMRVEIKEIYRKKITVDLFNDECEVFAIALGKIIETKNI